VINLDWTFVFQLVNFGVLVLLLNVFLYKPIRKVLADRAEQISGARAKTIEVDREVQEKMALYEARLRDVRSKAGEERAAMVKEAQAEEAQLIDKARKEAADSLSTIKTRIAGEVAAAKGLLKEQAGSLSLEICEKVLGRSL
jgi:F-type H+-transporting ATPase subunit b